MRESIISLDVNYTNAGGGHTASVTTVEDGKTLSGDKGLGTVIGPAGDVNDFSNPEIAAMLGRFICTQQTTSVGPNKKSVVRRYSDRTSMLLESVIVVVRGIGCGPEGGSEERNIAYYSEVKGSPVDPFRAMGPQFSGSGGLGLDRQPLPRIHQDRLLNRERRVLSGRLTSVIEAGRIYNQESAANYEGEKISLVYNRGVLVEPLCLNLHMVSQKYLNDPDLSQFELKFGYTLQDFKTMIGMLGIPTSGIETDDSILFETSGTLASVVSSVASYLGYFWYVHPSTGAVTFVDTQKASTLPVTDYTGRIKNPLAPPIDLSNIISASFTESLVTNKIVNTYSGTTERKEPLANNADSNIRSRRAFFKNVKLESFDAFKFLFGTQHNTRELGTFFALFNQEESTEVFDMYTYVVLLMMVKPKDKKSVIQSIGKGWFDYDFNDLYKPEPRGVDKWAYVKGGANAENHLFPEENKIAVKLSTKTKLDQYPNRIGNKFLYYPLNTTAKAKLPRASGTDLYNFLKAYFSIAGGVYISNGYSEYKANRMQFTNTNICSVIGPFENKELISDIPDLAALSDILGYMKLHGKTIGDLAKHTDDRAKTKNDWHFIALKQLPKLQMPQIKRAGQQPVNVDFQRFMRSAELVEGFPNRPTELFIGGPTPEGEWGKNINNMVLNMLKKSCENYLQVIKRKNILGVKYQRSKTKVNNLDAEDEEKEDDAISESSDNDQKSSDLFDRFDMRFWDIQQPNHNILNKLSLSGSSGSTKEMKALRDIRGPYRDSQRGFSPKSSSRTHYGLEIPIFQPTMNSVSITVGTNGITTTVNESSIKIIPPDQSFLQTRGNEAAAPKSYVPQELSASQKNMLGL